jgi:hypothetical protein
MPQISPNNLLLLQALLIFLQMGNAAIASLFPHPAVPMLMGAFVGSLQFYIQHIGNEVCPPKLNDLKASLEVLDRKGDPR